MKKCGVKKYAAGGAVTGVKKFKSGDGMPDATMGSGKGKTTSQPVKKTVKGDNVAVRGVGAARARTATIY